MKLVQKTSCPHCNKDFELESDLDKIEMAAPKQTATSTSATAQILEQQTTEQKAETPKVEIKHVIPSHIPAYSCADDSCNQAHKNKNYTKMPVAKCENCGQFTANKDKICPWCKSKDFEDLDQEDLVELGLPVPEVHDHGDENAL